MYDHIFHRGKNHFCCYCLQAFNTEKILKFHFSNCFKINVNQRIKMPKKSEYVRSKFMKGT